MKIRLLPDNLINKIAAGEVVDRPASVVKELVENALDAGARRIDVLLEQGGKASIEVRDDGCGMERDDALMAFERHATSKVREESDLFNLVQHGFRGEALPSIAAVAKVELRTRTNVSDTGWQVQINGGVIAEVKPIAGAVGTTIKVARLFYNTPVRKKFLRSEQYEAARVRTVVRNLALVNPSVTLQLIENGRVTFFLQGHTDFLARAHSQFRGSLTELAVSNPAQQIVIDGVVAHPALAETDYEMSLVLIVNNRIVRDRLLAKAVREGFHHTLKDKEYPVGVVRVAVSPSAVDVNVHPQKSEVRFTNPQQVFNLAQCAVYEAVARFKRPLSSSWEKVPTTTLGGGLVESPPLNYASVDYGSLALQQDPVEAEAVPGARSEQSKQDPVQTPLPTRTSPQLALANSAVVDPAPREQHTQYSEWRYLGQVSACYLLFDAQGALLVMDMHAAHERVNYARIMQKVMQDECLQQQPLLIPYRVHVGQERIVYLQERASELEQLGFVCNFDSQSGEVEICAEPSVPLRNGQFRREDLAFMFQAMATAEFWQSTKSGYLGLLAELVARRACHSSVRAGDILAPEEVKSLCVALDQIDLSAACPHGRPVSVEFSRSDMERWFGRS